MPRVITTIQIDVDLHNRIADIRGHVSMELRFSEHSLGLGPMLGLLVDHWQAHPPDREWLRSQSELYPKRGRPPKHITGSVVKTPSEKTKDRGHALIARKADEKKPYRIYYCRNCTMQFSTWDFDQPPAYCPSKGRISAIYNPKKWTKNELLTEGFTDDEVGWCDA